MQNLNKCTNTRPKPTVIFKNYSYVYVSLCTTVIHNTAQNSPNKHNCVPSNTGPANAPTKTGICTPLKSNFYFEFHSLLNTKLALLHSICTCDLVMICWQCGQRSLKTAEIAICTPLKSSNYFRFISQTIGVEATTFLSRMQNLVKIGKELWT